MESDVPTNTFDAANRLVETQRAGTTVEPIYNGMNNQVGQTEGVSSTNYALDVQGLPEVIYTSDGNAYLHLPGVIMTQSAVGEVRYLLSDGLGSVRQVVNEVGTVVSYKEFDPYGNPILDSPFAHSSFGFTGEWWEEEVGLLHLRARWYAPETGTFLSRDPIESEPPYQYVRGNVVNRVDPSGFFSDEIIRNSLQRTDLGTAFRDRPGLYYLLRDADNNNTVDPLVVDFDSSWSNVRYPLRNPVKSTVAKITCENDQLRFHLGTMGGSSYGLTLNQYLIHLNDAARQQWNAYRWRDKTVRLHYYRLIHRTGVSYYEDFGDESYLPDYIGLSGSGGSSKTDFGGGVTFIQDRYGHKYVATNATFGFGVPHLPPVAGGVVEGYDIGHDHTNSKYSIPDEATLKSSITGFGLGIGGAVGLGQTIDTGFIEYSVGLDAGIGLFVGLAFPLPVGKYDDQAWDWLERIRTGGRKSHLHFEYWPPETENRFNFYSGNDCSCGSP